MEYRQFGRTGPECFRHRLRLLGNQRHLRPDRRRAVRPAVHRALDAGIDCFDTAEAYGMGISEQALARAWARAERMSASLPRSVSAIRKRPIAATRAAPVSWPRSSRSLRDLGTDHVDVYLCTGPI